MSLNDNTPLEGPEGDVDATAGHQVKDTFSELGNSADNEGQGGAGTEDGGEETVRDWPPLHMD